MTKQLRSKQILSLPSTNKDPTVWLNGPGSPPNYAFKNKISSTNSTIQPPQTLRRHHRHHIKKWTDHGTYRLSCLSCKCYQYCHKNTLGSAIASSGHKTQLEQSTFLGYLWSPYSLQRQGGRVKVEGSIYVRLGLNPERPPQVLTADLTNFFTLVTYSCKLSWQVRVTSQLCFSNYVAPIVTTVTYTSKNVYKIDTWTPVGLVFLLCIGLIINTVTQGQCYKTLLLTNCLLKNFTVDKLSVEKLSVDKLSVDKMSVDKMSVDKMSVDKMSVGKMSVDKMSVVGNGDKF